MDNGASSYRRFLDGDENGLVEIIRDYKDGLIFYLNSFTNNLTAAEELAEDVFVRLGTKKPRDKGKSSFKTWLYTIGRNMAIDKMRKKTIDFVPYEELSGAAADDDVERAYLREEQKITVHCAMKKLRSEYQQALWLVYFEGFSLKDTAMIMKKSTHAAETLVYRARNALKTELSKEGFCYEEL